MAGSEAQDAIMEALAPLVDGALLKHEWDIRKQAEDTFGDKDSYAPRLDVAVGPFNSTFDNRFHDAYLIQSADTPLIRAVASAIVHQNLAFFENPNPRCLFGIEVEHTTTEKHILGGITNASLLGRFGIMIGTPENMGTIRRIHGYVRKLKEVGKAPPNMFGNVGVFSLEEFLHLVTSATHPSESA